jgi:probable rRNA maturation factor
MIEVNNLMARRIENSFLSKIAKKVLIGENIGTMEISIVLLGPAKMKELNHQYRRRNAATDVLSFLYQGSGEIVICPTEVKKNTREFNNTFNNELVKVLIHGLLHLAGYDHEKSQGGAREMMAKQNYYLKICQRLIY